MPAPRVLFVKLSSLGDVIHHFPAVTELAAHRPDVRIAWAVEEAYAELVRLHPGVAEAIPVGMRKLRRNVFDAAQWRRFAAARRTLRQGKWDFVVDAQGLLKSALVARSAKGIAFGFDRSSARERLAARYYDVKVVVPREMHAVERNRALVGEVFGYRVAGEARYGLAPPAAPPSWAPPGAYAVLLHAASREEKHWPGERWIALANLLAERGYASVFPGGTPAERAVAARLADAIPGAIAAPAMSLVEAAALLAHAWLVVGVDTGLTHLAAALGRPTIGIYCATDPALTGLHGGAHAISLGARGAAPTFAEVAAAIGGSEAR